MRLVVIGGEAAGLSAASRARRIDSSLEIVVLEKGETISYAACGLPYYVAGLLDTTDPLVTYTPEFFGRERNIAVRVRAEVAAIEHPRRQIVLANGERVPYDRLVIATGARTDRNSIPGSELPHVFSLHSLPEAIRLRSFLERARPKRAAVIGAGYIGLEAAEALRTHGLRVTVFDSSRYALGRTDADLTSALRGHLERFHIDLRLDTPVAEVDGGRVHDDTYDVVVLASGLIPNVELAAEAGVRLGRTGAILATDHMETSLGGVYAAGDCVETIHVVTGRPAYVPLGTTANKTGRVAGANAAGRRERFGGVAGTAIVSVCGLAVATTGLSLTEARTEGFDAVSARVESRDRSAYFRSRPTTVELVAERGAGRLLGGVVLGERDAGLRINVVAAALTSRMRIEEFERLDLAYAPPFAPVWDPLLIAARQLAKLIN